MPTGNIDRSCTGNIGKSFTGNSTSQAKYDTDPLNKGEAGQKLATRAILKSYAGAADSLQPFIDVVRSVLLDDAGDKSLRAYAVAIKE